MCCVCAWCHPRVGCCRAAAAARDRSLHERHEEWLLDRRVGAEHVLPVLVIDTDEGARRAGAAAAAHAHARVLLEVAHALRARV